MLEARFGAPWQFNQIVGWARLYALGTQLRADGWLAIGKRFVSSPVRKRIEFYGNLVEFDAREGDSSVLASRLRAELLDAVREMRRGRLHLDLRVFDRLAPLVDLRAIVAAASSGPIRNSVFGGIIHDRRDYGPTQATARV